ncbi:hypothetical protein [Oceanithermus sp.]
MLQLVGKKKKLKKQYQKQLEEARKPTFAKMLRLFIKTFALFFGLLLLMSIGIAYGLDFLKNWWAQLAVYAAGYIVLQPWLMSDFRPPPPKGLKK